MIDNEHAAAFNSCYGDPFSQLELSLASRDFDNRLALKARVIQLRMLMTFDHESLIKLAETKDEFSSHAGDRQRLQATLSHLLQNDEHRPLAMPGAAWQGELKELAQAYLAFSRVIGEVVSPSRGVLAAGEFGFGIKSTAEDLKNFVSPLSDGRGLPPGSGSVVQGKAIYEVQCVACHGDKLQGGIGDKLIGGRGSLVNSDTAKAPAKTVESYWLYATTLSDYVKCTVPLYTLGSLSNDEVYAVSAFILSEAKIVGPDATLDARTLPQVQMPNRNGFVPDHRPESFVPASRSSHSI